MTVETSHERQDGKGYDRVVVPAPEEPVTAITGWLMDTQNSPQLTYPRTRRSKPCLRPEQRTFVKER